MLRLALGVCFSTVTVSVAIWPCGASFTVGRKRRSTISNGLCHNTSSSFGPTVKDAPHGHIATLTVTVEKHTPNAKRNMPYRVRCQDETGPLDLVFFNPHKDYIEKQLPVGATVIVSGRVDHYQGRAQIVHPDAIGTPEEIDEVAVVEPVYPLTQGLTNKPVRKAVLAALEKAPAQPLSLIHI